MRNFPSISCNAVDDWDDYDYDYHDDYYDDDIGTEYDRYDDDD